MSADGFEGDSVDSANAVQVRRKLIRLDDHIHSLIRGSGDVRRTGVMCSNYLVQQLPIIGEYLSHKDAPTKQSQQGFEEVRAWCEFGPECGSTTMIPLPLPDGETPYP